MRLMSDARHTGRSSTLARLAEIVAGCIIAALLVGQLLIYPVTDDPDPDGYVTYARYLQNARSLTDSARLPGYPAFLAVVDRVGPASMHVDAYWAQFGLYLCWVACLWWAIRRLLGPLIALAFVAVLAAPAFPTRYAVVMVADLLGMVTFGLAAIALFSVATARTRAATLMRLSALGALAGLAFVIHPSTRMMLALLTVCLALAAVACRGRFGPPDASRLPLRGTLVRLGSALVVVIVATGAVAAVADRGSTHYNSAAFVNWMLVCLPPVTDTEDDWRIEEMKAAASARLGYPIERATPMAYPEFFDLYIGKFPGSGPQYRTIADLDGGLYPNERIMPLLRERFLARPLEPLRCGLQQLLWRYHILVKQYAPFTSEVRTATLAYLPETGSPRSDLYRTFGIELPEVPDSAPWPDLISPLVREVGRILLFALSVGVGAVILIRRFGAPALAVTLAVLIWSLVLGLIIVLDARYLLGFVPAIYLAEVVGILAFVRAMIWFESAA